MVEIGQRLVEKRRDPEENLKSKKKGTVAMVQGNEAEETI